AYGPEALRQRRPSYFRLNSTPSSSGITGRGRRVHSKRASIGEVRPGRSTSTIWSGPKNSSKPPRKWPRDLTTTERAPAMSSPIISKKIGAAHCTRAELEPEPGIDAPPPDAIPVGQRDDFGRDRVRLGELGGFRAIEPRFE